MLLHTYRIIGRRLRFCVHEGHAEAEHHGEDKREYAAKALKADRSQDEAEEGENSLRASCAV